MISPAAAAMMEAINTAPAAVSLARLARGRYSCVTRSHRASIAVFTSSRPMIKPNRPSQIHHSVTDICRIRPKKVTRAAIVQWIFILRSSRPAEIPSNACPKLFVIVCVVDFFFRCTAAAAFLLFDECVFSFVFWDVLPALDCLSRLLFCSRSVSVISHSPILLLFFHSGTSFSTDFFAVLSI